VSVLRIRGKESSASPATQLSPQFLHDLRNPLNQIIGYAELLTEDAAGTASDRFVSDLEKISSAGRRMLTLLEGNSATPEPVSAPSALSDQYDRTVVRTLVAPPVRGVSGLLLVVDDDAINREVLSRRLKRQGYEVITAASGPEAMHLMEGHAFDLVLLDIMMPDMDGYEVLSRLKADERLQQIPVIMISALNEVQSVVRCIEAGADDFLSKPFDPTLLKARIGACLEKKSGRDRENVLFEQLQQNYRRLQEAEKLRDDLRNMIVHDLRTPLTGVIVGVEMLAGDEGLDETQRELISIALSGGKTLLGMINDLLDVEKMESGAVRLNFETLNVSELVAGAVAQVSALATDKRIGLALELGSHLKDFRGDRDILTRTLVNLLANAIKFTDSGTVALSCSQTETKMRFAVSDTGAGIPPEAFERIFEKFGQVGDQGRVGTGLGLTFCKLAVEAHGGSIMVQSTAGIGSTFSFIVPLETS
jgi:signal transduction histidine kinase